MKGSITSRGRDIHQICIDLGKDDFGMRQRRYFTVKGNKGAAQKKMRELLSIVDRGESIDITNETVGAYLQRWLRDYAEANLKPRTIQGYRGNVERYIMPKLGNIRLSKLTPQQILSLYSDMRDKGLSNQTIVHCHRVLHQALGHAKKWGLVMRNVCESVNPPRAETKEMKTLSVAQLQRLLAATEESTFKDPIFLAIHTGLRRSEILALRWRDVNLQHNTLIVTRSLSCVKGKPLEFTSPKTDKSQRTIDIAPSIVKRLMALKLSRKAIFDKAGIEWSEDGLIFCNAYGEPWHPDSLSHAFSKIVDKCDIPHVRFHDMRHSYATLLLQEGVNVKVIQGLLGHANISTTLGLYSHVMPGMGREAALRLDEVLQSVETEQGLV